jgi:hypothetical protein
MPYFDRPFIPKRCDDQVIFWLFTGSTSYLFFVVLLVYCLNTREMCIVIYTTVNFFIRFICIGRQNRLQFLWSRNSTSGQKSYPGEFLLSKYITKLTYLCTKRFPSTVFIYLCKACSPCLIMCQWWLTVTVDSDVWSLESWIHSSSANIHYGNQDMESIDTHDPTIVSIPCPRLIHSRFVFSFPMWRNCYQECFGSFAWIASPLSYVMYMHMQITGSVLQMQSHQGWKFVVQETDKEIQRWISVLYCWLLFFDKVILLTSVLVHGTR